MPIDHLYAILADIVHYDYTDPIVSKMKRNLNTIEEYCEKNARRIVIRLSEKC